MKNVHYEIILQSLTEDLLRRDTKIKDLKRRYDELDAVHTADMKSYQQKDRQIKELQDGIDKLTNEKKELAKSLQNSSADKKKEDAQQKAISECVDLVNQIYDFCKEHNLRLTMDFVNDVNDRKVPRIGIWNNVDGDIALCHVTYSFDWITTLKNMRDGSLICVGKGNPDWLFSAPHGAGRLMSRKQAFDTLDLNEYRSEMSGIYSSSVCEETIDESPMAYKPMQEIIDCIEPTVEVKKIIKPIYNFKAKSREIR